MRGFFRLGSLDYDIHDFLDRSFAVERLFALGAEFYSACLEGEEGMVLTYGDVGASHDGRTALTHDYRACLSRLAVCKLDTQVFGL